MQIDIIPPDKALPVERAYVLSMVIKTFKGRKDVEVHLFRPDLDPDQAEGYAWDELIEDTHHPDVQADFAAARKVLMEAFTEKERDLVIDYLKKRYVAKLESIASCAMNFPAPLGIPALSQMPEGKTIGFIRFEKIPNYTLPFPVHGLYDLAQHEPIVREEENQG